MKMVEETRPDISEAIRIAREIIRIWNRVLFRFANLDISATPIKICLGKTESHEVCVEDSFIQLIPHYDIELNYQDLEYEIDLTNEQCYIRIDEDTKFKVHCIDIVHILLNLDKASLEQRVKRLKVLKSILEYFLAQIEFVFGFNS